MAISAQVKTAVAVTISAIAINTTTTAFAYSNQFCIRAGEYTPGGFAYVDRNVGNKWTSTASRPLRGVHVVVKNNNTLIFSGSADQVGCTPDLTMSQGTFQLNVYSWGYPLYPTTSTALQIRNNTTGPAAYEIRTMNGTVGSSWTKYVDPLENSTQDIWFLYAAAAETLHDEPVSGLFKLLYNRYILAAYTTSGTTSIGYRSARNRFTIAHELGHQYMDIANEAVINSASYAETGCISNCPESCRSALTPNGGGLADCVHKLTSNEYMTAAFVEGWANYVAAKIWNTTSSCFWPQYNLETKSYTGVNCWLGTPEYPANYIRWKCEPSCTSSSSSDCLSHGVELDWLRTFWRTGGSQNCGGTIPAWLAVFADITIGLTLDPCNAFEQLDSRVAGTPFEACWTSAAGGNGINRPSGTCNPPMCR